MNQNQRYFRDRSGVCMEVYGAFITPFLLYFYETILERFQILEFYGYPFYKKRCNNFVNF